MQPGEMARVALIGLHPVTAPLGDQGRRDDIATHSHADQPPIQVIARRARLITRPQLRTVVEPADQTTDRDLVVEDLLHRRPIPIGRKRRHRDPVLRHVQT